MPRTITAIVADDWQAFDPRSRRDVEFVFSSAAPLGAPGGLPGLLKEVTFLLANRKSFNFYVAHGGTNFGFTAGAGIEKPPSRSPGSAWPGRWRPGDVDDGDDRPRRSAAADRQGPRSDQPR